jgi:anti-anti-sigma factor
VSAGQNATAGGPTAIEAEVSDFDLVTQAIGTTRLVVDLTEVTFVDSVSVGAILHAQKRLGLEGRLAVVLAPSSYARVIFDVVGADAVLDVVQTRAQALSRVTD